MTKPHSNAEDEPAVEQDPIDQDAEPAMTEPEENPYGGGPTTPGADDPAVTEPDAQGG